MRKIILFAFIFYLLSFIFGGSHPVQATSCATADIADGKPVNVSSQGAGTPKENLVNCEYGDTGWAAANTSLPQYAEIDLGSLQEVGSIKLQIMRLSRTGNVTFQVWLGNGDAINKNYVLPRTYSASTNNGQVIELGLGNSKVRWVKIVVTALPTTTSTASFSEIEVFNAVNCYNLTGPSQITAGSGGTFTAYFRSPMNVLYAGMAAGKDGNWYWNVSPLSYAGDIPGQSYSRSFTWTPPANETINPGTYSVFCKAAYGNIAECRGNSLYVDDLPRFTCAGNPPSQPAQKNVQVVCPTNVTVSGSVTGAPTSVTISINGQQFSNIGTSYNVSVPWSSSYTAVPGAVSGYTASSVTKTGTGCSTSISMPTITYTPIVIADAGVVAMTSLTGTIDSGSGQISQSGNPPGFRLNNYDALSSTLKSQVSYNNLLNAVIKNSGVGSTTNLEGQFNCLTKVIYTTGKYDFYCYDGAVSFNNQLNAAFVGAGSASKTLVLYPINHLPFDVTFIPPLFSLNGRKIIVFIDDGSLTINGDLIVQPQVNAGIIFVLNKGGVSVAPSVDTLDGVYIFPGTFDDGASATQLVGSGSLIGTGAISLGFSRSTPGNTPAELWTYQPKYLELFRQSLAVPRYTWKELPPQ